MIPRKASLLLLAGMLALAVSAGAAMPVWDDAVLRLFAALPVQDQGRVKPLDTFAQFTLLKLNAKRTYMSSEGKRITALEWLLDTLFYPEVAREFRCFIVDSDEVIEAIRVLVHDKKRDRYGYNELLAGREALMDLASTYSKIPAQDRSRIQQQILHLAENLLTFEQIAGFFDFARRHFTVAGQSQLAHAFPETEGVPLSVVLQRAPAVLRSVHDNLAQLNDVTLNNETDAMRTLLEEVSVVEPSARALTLFPPVAPGEKNWRSPADLMAAAFDVENPREEPYDLLADLERLPLLRDDPAALRDAVQRFHDTVVTRARARGEYRTIPAEVAFYRGKYFFYSQWLYVLSFLLVAISWLAPQRKWLYRATPPAVLIPTAYLVAGITLRCIIRGRPPVTTLYETLLFSTAVAVLVCLFIEWLNRQRIAVALAALLGTLGLFIANRYEVKEAVDTMPALVAVLDTNFWLSTHVTTITVGYSAGLVAGAMAHVYILGRLIGYRKADPAFYAGLGRMVYGVVCFGLLFSAVGTVLGGIWANESWGRFWGWDPKENGALMIVLWCLILLHARRGGYIGLLGVNIGAVILAMVVAFSWWGVNLLGVGLHSYGFTTGIMTILAAFWMIEMLVVLLGLVLRYREPAPGSTAMFPTSDVS